MGRVEPARGVEEIAAFGDGQRHDADVWIGERRDDGGEVARLQVIDHRADDMRLAPLRLLLDHGGQPILRRQEIPRLAVPVHHPGADDRPVLPLAGGKQPVQIIGLMGPVEIADAEMQDARGQVVARIGGPAHRPGQIVKRCEL